MGRKYDDAKKKRKEKRNMWWKAIKIRTCRSSKCIIVKWKNNKEAYAYQENTEQQEKEVNNHLAIRSIRKEEKISDDAPMENRRRTS